MPAATIHLDDHDEELAVFGSRDQILRQVRESLGVKVSARHGEVRVEGDADRVDRARKVFEELRALYRRQKAISADEVLYVIDSSLRKEEDAESTGSGSMGALEIRQNGRVVRPRTGGQARYMRALHEHEMVFCVGPAGTGKTYLAVANAVEHLRQGRIKKIVLARPAVEAGERLGFLPGDLEAKINPYLRPLFDALHDLMDYHHLRRYIDNDLIEIAPLAYMRGRTLNDAVIILDEAQNATVPQMKMFLTRMGKDSRIVVTGDVTQVDLPSETISGLADAVDRLRSVEGIAITFLDKSDIVRHPLVQAIVNAYEPQDQRGQGLNQAREGFGGNVSNESTRSIPRPASLKNVDRFRGNDAPE